jgi:hypothetical protein
MQRRNAIAIALYGVIILSIAYMLLADQGFSMLIALFR